MLDRCLNPPCAARKGDLFVAQKVAALAAKHPTVLRLQEGWTDRPIPGALRAHNVEQVTQHTTGAIPAVIACGANLGAGTGGAPNSAAPPPIATVLAADGLARAIGVKPDGSGPVEEWHVLWLKALESGGSVITKSNLLGSKVFFSGGAVATYALFSLDGKVTC